MRTVCVVVGREGHWVELIAKTDQQCVGERRRREVVWLETSSSAQAKACPLPHPSLECASTERVHVAL